jgi:hypothetical protein
MFQGLSTDQAPPISVPFRFFLTAPIFGILIALSIFFNPVETILNRYSPIAIGITHLFTLGILSMIIIGALQQMLPVLAGAVIKKPLLFANIIHINLTLGTLALSGGFIYSNTLFLTIGAFFLSISFFTFFIIIIRLLFKVKYITSTVKAMKIYAVVGSITILLGLYLVGAYISGNITSFHYIFVNIHIVFAVFGFATIIIMGVAFQVIPMFYVANDLPKYIQNTFPILIVIMLILFSIFTILDISVHSVKIIFAILLSLFAIYGLKSLNNRRRFVFDVTLWYWKISLISLIISMYLYIQYPQTLVLPIIFAFGFLYSLLQGMIYKIVPFLSWFHLNSKGYFTIPTIREFIKEENIKIQFAIYLASIFFFILGVYFSILLYLGSGLFIVSNLILIFNLITASNKYYQISLTNPMDIFK